MYSREPSICSRIAASSSACASASVMGLRNKQIARVLTLTACTIDNKSTGFFGRWACPGEATPPCTRSPRRRTETPTGVDFGHGVAYVYQQDVWLMNDA